MDINKIPKKPGVYLFKDNKGRVIYVGKAKDLKSRVSSYFNKDASSDVKIRGILELHKDIEFVITNSEYEAFLLESNLIKKHMPRFNSILKDDKSYPYIVITREDFPRALVNRGGQAKGWLVFGPFFDVKMVRAAIERLRGSFGIRSCSRDMGRASKVCLEFHMGRCRGPCAGMVSKEEYGEGVTQLVKFLKGDTRHVIGQLDDQMERASEKGQFEIAARIRDQLSGLRRLIGKQRVVSSGGENFDVLGVAIADDEALVQVFSVRDGRLEDEKRFAMKHTEGSSTADLLDSFCSQFYTISSFIPHILVVPEFPSDQSTRSMLEEHSNHKVEFIVPKSGAKKDLLELAALNAREKLGTSKVSLDGLKRLFDMKRIPKKIECYDISNIGSKWAVGSMVTFSNGVPDKSLYRRFRIKRVEGQDDYAMLSEIVDRRFKHKEWGLPDLVLIDGGPGQVSQVNRTMQLLEVSVPLVGIAKEKEELFLAGSRKPIILPLSDPSLTLLRQCRDEAHRFAKAYHKKVRSRIDA